MKNFKELKIWQKGFIIAANCLQLTREFPKEEKFGIVSQINRAGISIVSNIAEGSSRNSFRDYNRFLQMALGSCFELETQLLLSIEACFGNKELITETILLIYEEEKMLMAFSKTLLNNNRVLL